MIYRKDFQSNIKIVNNPYDGGETSKKIIDIIKRYPLNNIIKKKFYSI